MKFSKSSSVLVLCGGLSREREVSLRTGNAICNALVEKGYSNTKKIDVGHDIAAVLAKEKPDAAFIALHGKFGEDGTIQGILEFLSIPYTGSGVLGSSTAMDKAASKRMFEYFKLPTLPWILSSTGETFSHFKQKLFEKFSLPVIGKPSNEGSTIGIEIVREEKELEKAFAETLKFDATVVWEPFRKGREITVSVMKGEAFPIVEIRPKSGFYDYASKYTKGATEYICPAEIDKDLTLKIQKIATQAHSAVRCSTYSRVDFILEDEQPWLLEVNTIPGMTETSLLPMAAKAKGLSFGEVCEIILQDATLVKF